VLPMIIIVFGGRVNVELSFGVVEFTSSSSPRVVREMLIMTFL